MVSSAQWEATFNHLITLFIKNFLLLIKCYILFGSKYYIQHFISCSGWRSHHQDKYSRFVRLNRESHQLLNISNSFKMHFSVSTKGHNQSNRLTSIKYFVDFGILFVTRNLTHSSVGTLEFQELEIKILRFWKSFSSYVCIFTWITRDGPPLTISVGIWVRGQFSMLIIWISMRIIFLSLSSHTS